MSKLSTSVPHLATKGAKPDSSTAAAPAMSNSDLLSALGSSKSMPAPVQAKMEGVFGIGLSDVSLYESPLVSQNGAEAVASGNKIAFAPGKLNPSSAPGQELLGHELSHVAAQKRGEVSGSGFLNDSSLEHRADREGALAAKGSSIFGGEAGGLSPMSGGGSISSAPMQAKKPDVEYTPSAAEQLNDRTSSISTDNMQHYGLASVALQRQTMRQQETPQQFDPDYEEAYQKKISSMSKDELAQLLKEHSRLSAYSRRDLDDNRDFFYYDSIANDHMDEEQSGKFADGMLNYSAKSTNGVNDFFSYEALLQDIQANPLSMSGKNLSQLTGKGGQYEHMEDAEHLRNLFSMGDQQVDAAMQSRSFTKNKAPLAKARAPRDAGIIASGADAQQRYSKKMRPWWQFWK